MFTSQRTTALALAALIGCAVAPEPNDRNSLGELETPTTKDASTDDDDDDDESEQDDESDEAVAARDSGSEESPRRDAGASTPEGVRDGAADASPAVGNDAGGAASDSGVTDASANADASANTDASAARDSGPSRDAATCNPATCNSRCLLLSRCCNENDECACEDPITRMCSLPSL